MKGAEGDVVERIFRRQLIRLLLPARLLAFWNHVANASHSSTAVFVWNFRVVVRKRPVGYPLQAMSKPGELLDSVSAGSFWSECPRKAIELATILATLKLNDRAGVAERWPKGDAWESDADACLSRSRAEFMHVKASTSDRIQSQVHARLSS